MPKLTRQIPSYRHHKPSGRAVVTIAGKDIYLGAYNSSESRAEYDRVIAEWLASKKHHAVQLDAGASLTVSELVAAYMHHVDSYYVKDGRPTSEVETMRQALGPVRKLYGPTAATSFGPSALKSVRQEMIEREWCRGYINKQVMRVRRMFSWAVESELVPVTVYQALTTVAGLAKNRSSAREKPPIGPVSDDHVDAVLALVNPVVGAMIRVQKLTGMRPQEVILLRPVDVDQSDTACWVYRPHRHKGQHHERERLVFIGPRAQAFLRPWLNRAPDAYCFSPTDAVTHRNTVARANRKSPMTPSQAARKPKADALHRPGLRYTKDSYRVAIQRACRQAKIALWAPNQLRHSQATELRKRFGIEAAQAVLGHSDLGVTQVYAERDMAKARDVMREAG